MINEYYEGYTYANAQVQGSVCRLVYACASCKDGRRYFVVRFDQDGDGKAFVVKVGQYPPWDIAVDAVLESNLGIHADYYRKGLICESQGYGIGAFSYYRRIIEETIDSLLDDIAGLMSGVERAQYDQALTQTKQTRVAGEKIELVKDLLPPLLRPEGINPLGVLHGALSEGLHARSDEECMEDAAEIREALVFLITQTAASKASARSFSQSIRRLLGKKAKPSA